MSDGDVTVVFRRPVPNGMSPEKPGLESFFGFGKKKETPAEKPEDIEKKALSLAQEAEQLFADNDFAGAAEKLRELKRLTKPELRESMEFREAREIFGKDFIGPEAIEKTWGLKLTSEELEQIEQIPFSREELEQAKKLGMMLVLRTPQDKAGKPLTIDRMREIFDKGDTLGDPKKKKSKIFYSKKGEGWYNKEDFANKPTPKLGWGLAMKEVLPESLGKNWDEQEAMLKEWAKKNKIDPTTVKRRTPVEVAYDTLTYYGENQESLLENTYDWTLIQSSGGRLVGVGGFGAGGLGVDGIPRGTRDSTLGVCPSR